MFTVLRRTDDGTETTAGAAMQESVLAELTLAAIAGFEAAGLRYEVIDGQVTLTQHGQVVGS